MIPIKRHIIAKWFLATLFIGIACSAQAFELKLGTNVPPVDFHGFASQ
jgi:hypothetical protein